MISIDTFFLDPTAPGTLQSRIQQMVAQGILSGRFRTGERVPSSRALAAHLRVSRITVTLAYTELVADDYLQAKGRSGYYVSANAPEPPDFPAQAAGHSTVNWGGRLPAPALALGLVKPADWASYRYNFIYGQSDPTLFDSANWRLCALQALGKRDFEALTADQYDRDDPLLIDYITRQTLPRRGILAAPDQILLTMGAQNALWLTAQLLTPGRNTVIEDPGYPALRSILSQTRCTLTALPVDAQGLDPATIPPGTDVVFTTPAHQCPTTVTMPPARRAALLDRAEAEDMLIVEDDYEFDLPHLTAAAPALKSADRGGRVIYVGSFSKSIFPGLRLGYLVGPAPFIAQARALRASVLRHPPGHLQRTTAYFLSLGHYDAQIRRTARAYHERRRVMEAALGAAGLEVAGKGAFGGSSFWMRARGVDTVEWALGLRAQGVLIEPGGVFFAGGGMGNGFALVSDTPQMEFYRLAYSSIASTKVIEGINLMSTVLNSGTFQLGVTSRSV